MINVIFRIFDDLIRVRGMLIKNIFSVLKNREYEIRKVAPLLKEI